MFSSIRRKVAVGCAAAAFAALAAPASAQQAGGRDGGIPTETQERLSQGQDQSFDWNWIGLLGLFGIAGLRHRPDYGHAV